MSVGGDQFRCVRSNVLGRKFLEPNDALGDLQHGRDEAAKCLKLWFQTIRILRYFRQLLQNCKPSGKGVGGVKLRDQPEFTIVHGKSCYG